MEDTVNRIVERRFPELVSGFHLPRFARVTAIADPPASTEICDDFRPRYAVDVQVLNANGEPDAQLPILPGVPLPVMAGGNEQGLFGFPEEGTVVVICFAYGLPNKPFILQILPHDLTLPPVPRGDQLWQHSEQVKQRADAAGNWWRETNAAIRDCSIDRHVSAISNREEYQSSEQQVDGSSREQIGATKTIEAFGGLELLSGGVTSLHSLGNLQLGTEGACEQYIAHTHECTTGGDLNERIHGMRNSIAGLSQKLQAPRTWIGSENVNVLQILTDLISLVEQMNSQLTTHAHGIQQPPENASDFESNAQRAAQLNGLIKSITA